MSKARSLQYKKHVLGGTMLCIDPSSGKTSAAGWALFKEGRLVESGLVTVCSVASREIRLREILACVQADFDPVDLLVIEKIDGRMAKRILIQACGVYMSAIDSKSFFEMNVQSWQAISKRLGGWKKTNSKGVVRGDPKGREGDEVDAEYIGWSAIAFALGYDQTASEEDNEIKLKLVRERM